MRQPGFHCQPSYAQESLIHGTATASTPFSNQRSWKLSGILNGIDTISYDPATDQSLFTNYSAEDPAGKMSNKLGLQDIWAFLYGRMFL